MGNIYLVGFMAVGKTSVGQELAKKKKWLFVDTDNLIELKEKMAIADIFAKKGEEYFRKAETEALKKVSREKNFVVACGGGIVIKPLNIKIMKETGKIICLSALPEVILKRASGCARRPLLNVKDPKKQIEHLIKLRFPYYAHADKTVDTSKLSISEAADKIAELIAKSRRLKLNAIKK